jgi:hypothetical protein
LVVSETPEVIVWAGRYPSPAGRVKTDCWDGVGCGTGAGTFVSPAVLLGDRLKGMYRFLAAEGDGLFPDGCFADLYRVSRRGRPTVPAPSVAHGDGVAGP